VKSIYIGLLIGTLSFMVEIFFAMFYGIMFYFLVPTIFALIGIVAFDESKLEHCLLISLTTYVSRTTFLTSFFYGIALYMGQPITITITDIFDVLKR